MGDLTENKKNQELKADTIVIRPAHEGDVDGLKSVWRDAFGPDIFGGETVYDKFFKWAFIDNPDCDGMKPTAWVADWDNDIVAAWATLPAKLLIRGEEKEFVWLSNTAVATRAQRRGLGKRIYRKIIAANDLTLGVGVVPASRALYVKERARFVRADEFAVLTVSSRRALRNIIASTVKLRFPTALKHLRSFRSLRNAASQRPNAEISVRQIKEFDAKVDVLIKSVAKDVPVMTLRSAEQLNWLMQNPRFKPEVFGAFDGEKLRGYVIVRPDGMIIEWLVHPDDHNAFNTLLTHLLKWANRHGVKELQGITPSFPKFRRMYEQSGFATIDLVDFGLFYSRSNPDEAHVNMDDPKNWFVSLADSDLWSFLLNKD